MNDMYSGCGERRSFIETSVFAGSSTDLAREWRRLIAVLMSCCLILCSIPLLHRLDLVLLEVASRSAQRIEASTLPLHFGFWVTFLFNESVVPLVCVALYLLGPRDSLIVSACLACVLIAIAYAVLRWGHALLSPTAGVLTCMMAWPLWALRRQEALLHYLSQDMDAVMRELSLTQDLAPASRFSDPIQRRLNAMTSLSERVHRYCEFLAHWIDTLPEATLVTSRDGVVLRANERVLSLMRESEASRGASGSPSGRQVADVLFEITGSHRAMEFAARALSSIKPLNAADTFSPEATGLTDQGTEITSARGGRSLLVKCAPIFASDGHDTSLIFHIADVSSIRKAERQRDTALRFLSHDMRSPQTALLALVEQMRQQPPRFTQQRFTELVAHYAGAALRLSDDFLFLARAEGVAPKLTRVDPALALGDAVDDFWPQASLKSTMVDLIAEPGTSLIADAQLLRRAFGNLIGNAIKYSPPASTVRVRLSETPRHLRISVVDQGIGISVSDQGQLFTEFRQFDERFAGLGHGLGLAFVKTVVDSLGGRLFVRSKAGKGTVFSVRLPRADAALTHE